MKSTLMWLPIWHANENLLVSKTLLLFSFVGLLFSSHPSLAAYKTSEIPYGITYPSGLFQAGDTVELIVWAGDAQTPLSSVSGFDLTFTLTEDAVFPTTFSPDLSNSWIGDEQTLTVTTTLDSAAKIIDVRAEEETLAMDGHGEIFRFTIICATNEVSAEDLLVSSGGGIIITIDDYGFRKPAPEESDHGDALQLYPNPTSNHIYFSGPVESVQYWVLRDLYGKERAKSRSYPVALNSYALTEGYYILEVFLQSGVRVKSKIIYRPD